MIENVKRKFNIDDIWSIESHINCAFDNKWHLTTDQVKGMPLYYKERCVGKLTDADRDLIYGYVFDGSVLYKDKSLLSFVL